MLDRHTRVYLQAHGVKAHEMPNPITVPRPASSKPKPRPKPTREQVAGFLATKGIPLLPSKRTR